MQDLDETMRPLPEHSDHFVSHLQRLAQERPDEVWLTVVHEHDGLTVETPITYGVFERRVRALAALLQQTLSPGDRVLIMLDNDDHYAVSMLACFYAGVIAVPVFPPESTRPQHLGRLMGVAQDAQAACVLTSAALKAAMSMAGGAFGQVASIAADEVDPGLAPSWRPHEPQPDDVAFLQYTSGSTSAPKGVMVTHGNLMANERAIQAGMGIRAGDRFVSWAPLYHDMGLIGGLLQPLYSGGALVLTSPRYFLERPARWLELISRYRGTVSGGPDFSYRLCIERLKEQGHLDLSSWRVAYTGAEPVRKDTMDAFAERFASSGFDAGSVYACYGLAEATLFVTGGRRGEGLTVNTFSADDLAQGRAEPSNVGTALVGCGAQAAGHRAVIMDAASPMPLAEGCIGEIWASGPSIGAGYWGNAEATEATFVEHEGERWLRTGDLGFMRGGQLYVTGRIKDLIIVRGHNIYPQDIERTVEREVEAVRKGRVAAFRVDGVEGSRAEGIGVAAEVSRGMQKLVAPEALVDAIGAAVGEVFGEAPSVVLLLQPGALPKTSSGKLQRSACRTGWLQGGLNTYAVFEHGRFVQGGSQAQVKAPALAEGIEIELAGIWREVLRWPSGRAVTAETHFFLGGGNSLTAAQAALRMADHWEVEVPVRLLFEQPRLGQAAREIARLREAGQGRQRAQPVPALPAALRTGALPLSHAQERQWFLWQLDPRSVAYHVSLGLRLNGTLQVAALRAAMDDLVVRHEALRTVFRAGPDGTPGQWVQPAIALDVPLVDLRSVPAGEREAQAALKVQALNGLPFDLAQGPLLRAVLVRVGDEAHLLGLVMHHIVSDGASMQVLVNELAQRYREHASDGEAEALVPLPVQYADYAVWQREWLSAGARDRQLTHWREQLGASHPVLALPTDHPRQAVARYGAATHTVDLPLALTRRVQAQAQALGATTSMALLTAYAALLYRYTGQQDLRVGVPVANRRRPEIEGVVGLFVNTVVVRSTPHGRMTLAQLLAQTREASLNAQAHQDLPFEQLVEALQPQRSLSHSALFQVVFNHLQEDGRLLARMPGLAASLHRIDDGAAQFELMLDVREQPDGAMTLVFTYARELFEARTITRLAGHYQACLAALADDPSLSLGDVDHLSEEDRSVWHTRSMGAPASEMPAVPVHRLFEAQVHLAPEAVALRFGGASLSYQVLNERANRLARRLLRLSDGPVPRVAVAVAPSPDRVVALLACLKAGAVYVPVDPSHPTSRVAELLRDSGVCLLVTQPGLPLAQEGAVGVRTLSISEGEDLGEFALDLEVAVHEASPAYVIHTSGTTGQPKGVVVSHGALSMHLQAMAERCGHTAQDRSLQFATPHVDAAIEQTLLPLICGAGLVLTSHWPSLATELAALVADEGITVLDLPPAYARHLLRDQAPFPQSVRLVLLGGEASSGEDLALIDLVLRPEQLVNAYGPTEAVITPTAWRVHSGETIAGPLPIGRPVGQRMARVLDEHLQPVPEGMPGELYLGGRGLATGYLNRPGATAERFVADPWTPGARLYRTGDLVAWRPDGELAYLGRVDDQVKINGFRIELGEVESCLLGLPDVREALVLKHEGEDGASLVAYVTARPGAALAHEVLKDLVRDRLPAYMVPAAIVVLDRLPLNATGKVDRQVLPLPEPAASTAAYEAPQGPVAETLASVWAEVLGRDRVGLHDNFFDLGGTSLSLIRMHRLVEAQLRPGLTVVELFKFPTVGALARRIGQGGGSANHAEAEDPRERASRKRTAMLQRRAAAERAL